MASDNNKCNSACGAGWGGLWFMGWLFTIGFVKLSFWPAVLGLVIWPYYIGAAIR